MIKKNSIIVYLIFAIGIFIGLYYCFDYIKLNIVCVESLSVKCIDIKIYYDDHNNMTYSPIWQGKYNNKKIIFESDEYTSKTYKIGKTETIKINPNNLNEFIDSNKRFGSINLMIFTIVFIVLSFASLIKDLRKYEKEKFEEKIRKG